MRILITTGSTLGMIDKVRGIGNIFKGGTGTTLARQMSEQGHQVTLLSSNPGLVPQDAPSSLMVRGFTSFEDLHALMKEEIQFGSYDMIIHSVAVNDYRPDGLYAQQKDGSLIPISADGKIQSGQDGLFLRLSPTIKLLDLIRGAWEFEGVLVTFKLQVAMTDAELVGVALASMERAGSDIVVANCREWKDERAIVVSRGTIRPYRIQPIARQALTRTLTALCDAQAEQHTPPLERNLEARA